MKKIIYIIAACALFILSFSCKAKADVQDEEGHPVMIGEVSPFLEPAQTRAIIESVLWKNVIELPDEGMSGYFLEPVSDLEYFPYLHLCASSPIYRQSLEDNIFFGELYKNMCSRLIDDKDLFKAGKQFVDAINRAHEGKHYEDYTKRNGAKVKRLIWVDWEYPDSFVEKVSASNENHDKLKSQLTNVDTLRVRVVIHNDRKALERLEQYYRNKDDEKGLAIYYKVMLGYEGNGDLAERFYKVLAPGLDRNPQLKRTVREVLLRAALCDKNKRAQELCDSLGFSLCDYRLPKLDN